MSFHLLLKCPSEMRIKYNCENIPSGIFVTTIPGLKQKE
jgi:hypothetical protein